MRRGVWLAVGAGLGALTGLAMVAVAYLGQQALALPFIPFVFFEWLTRVLPGGIITLGIDSMVRIITGLGLGPIDVVAKGMEQFQGVVIWIVASAVIGLVLAAWLRSRAQDGRLEPGTGMTAGAVGGVVMGALVVLAMLDLRQSPFTQPWTLLWLVVLVVGWGIVLGMLLERAGAPLNATGAQAVEAETPISGPASTPVEPETHAVSPPSPRPLEAPRTIPGMSRRQFLVRAGGGSVLVALVAGGLGALLAQEKARTGAGQPLADLQAKAASPPTPAPGATAAPAGAPGASAPGTVLLPPTPSGRSAAAPGTRPEVTPTSDFYRIDIDLGPPELDGASWQMQVSGLFDHPRDLTLRDLLAMPAVTQPITQSCISNPIGGDLISSAYYTGVRLVDVLKELGLKSSAKELAIQSADGFYESVSTQDMQDPRVLLVYGLNGVSLPVEHGYPLRIYIPNHYGMKQPKWITSIEAIDHQGAGYWVDRGWNQQARPQVISIIDTVAKGNIDNGRVPVGGIAWAGDRGIQSVEVQVDQGAWAPANLITPPLGPLTWVQWRYDWPMAAGRHTFRVRATDGKGTLQNGQNQDTYPNGATGYHAVTVGF